MLNAALIYHLFQNNSEVACDLLHNLYIDNVVSGCHSEQAAVDYFLKSRSLLNSAHFNLHSWASNSPHLRSTAKEHNVAESGNPVKVLGLVWDVQTDLIYPSPKPEPSNFISARTKREILKCASSVFDPLGLISPGTISAKLFLQQLWQQRLDWDSDLAEELCKNWNTIDHDILHATEISFPRQCVTVSYNADATLHVFADASPKAYGAAAYFQLGMNSVLVMSKARAAPLQQHSLPRLELMAAVTAARLCSYISTSLNATSSVCLWSDSQIVLSWVHSKKSLKPFVSHPVSEIRSISTTWRYCPSADNPADLLTRGITCDVLKSSIQWMHGPI